MIKHTKKAILSSIIQTFISNFIGENIYIKSLNKFKNMLHSTEILNMFDHLPANSSKNKIIAYCLLLHILDDLDDWGGAASDEDLISFVKERFRLTTNINEIEKVIQIINKRYNNNIISVGGIQGERWMVVFSTNEGVSKTIIYEEIKNILNWN